MRTTATLSEQPCFEHLVRQRKRTKSDKWLFSSEALERATCTTFVGKVQPYKVSAPSHLPSPIMQCAPHLLQSTQQRNTSLSEDISSFFPLMFPTRTVEGSDSRDDDERDRFNQKRNSSENRDGRLHRDGFSPCIHLHRRTKTTFKCHPSRNCCATPRPRTKTKN